MIKVDLNICVINWNKARKIIGERIAYNQSDKNNFEGKSGVYIEAILFKTLGDVCISKKFIEFSDEFNLKEYLLEDETYLIKFINLKKKEIEKIIELYYK